MKKKLVIACLLLVVGGFFTKIKFINEISNVEFSNKGCLVTFKNNNGYYIGK